MDKPQNEKIEINGKILQVGVLSNEKRLSNISIPRYDSG